MDHYINRNGTVVKVSFDDYLKHFRETKELDVERTFAEGGRRVKQTTLPDGRWLSTVFLSLDHAFDGGLPLIFETMLFPSQTNLSDERCERYSTYEEAVAGHDRILAETLASNPEPPMPQTDDAANKYKRLIQGEGMNQKVLIAVDVYAVAEAWNLTPALSHALKKLLMAGQRGHKSRDTDLAEAIQSIHRERELSK